MELNNYTSRGKLEADELISLDKISQSDIFEILTTAKNLKTKLRFGEKLTKLSNKNIFYITKNSFNKSRIAFEIATRSLGANPITLPLTENEIGELLSSPENLKIISRFDISAAVMDTENQKNAVELSHNLTLPIINVCESAGACHALAILFTIWENRSKLVGQSATIVGDVFGERASIVYGLAKCGVDVKITAPTKCDGLDEVIEYATQFVDASYSADLSSSIKGADIIICFPHDFGNAYTLTKEKIDKLAPNAMFFENVPLERGKEADSALIDSENSKIYEQGENILTIERAAIYLLAK